MRKEAIDEEKKRKGIDLLLVVSTFSSLAEELYKSTCQWLERSKRLVLEGRTLKDGAGQVTLVLAATRSGGRTVWVGVLPLLEEFFGLVEQDLAVGEKEKSQRTCSQHIVAMALEKSEEERRVITEGWIALTLCCLGSRTLALASKRERMYMAWPRQRYRWTDQSRASLSDRRYRRL